MGRPIDRYVPTANQEVALTRLSFTITWTCLKSHGYSVSDPEPADYPAFQRGVLRDLVVRSDVYGFFDTQTVDTYGYLRPPSIPDHVALEPSNAVPDDIASACQSAGAHVIAPAGRDQLPNGGPQLATKDQRVVAAKGQWAACMARHGLAINDPIDAIGRHLTSTPADRAVAQTDVACKQETNFVGIASGVQAEIDNAYVTANLQALKSYAATVAALLRQAAQAAR